MFEYIKNREGKKIFAIIDYPRAKGPFPAVLIIHGFSGFSTERHLTAISDALVKHGFLTVRPDLTKNPGRSYLEFSEMIYSQELKDAEDVLDYLLGLKEFDKKRVGIAGHSLGGMLAAQLASQTNEIKALVALAAVYSFELISNVIFDKPYQRAIKDFKQKGFTNRWHSQLEKRLKIKRKFLNDIKERTAEDFAKNINCPTLIVSGANDKSVTQVHAERWMKNLGTTDKKMEIIEGSDHIYSGDALDKLTLIVANWFSQKLIKDKLYEGETFLKI